MLRVFKYIGYLLFLPFWWLQLLIPRNKNIWVFGAWYGHRFSDNSKYLYLYIKENHPEIKAIWLTRDVNIKNLIIREGGVSYLTSSLLAICYSLIAKNVIVSSGKRDINFLFINGSNWIHLWHGNPMKKIGLDDKYSNIHSFFQRKLIPVFFPFVCEYNYDYIVSNSEVFSEKMASAFNVAPHQIIESGCPRNDVFYNKEIDKFNADLKIRFKKCKIIYYLPTFRNHNKAKSLFNLEDFDENILEPFLEKENIVFVSKGHFVDNNLHSKIEKEHKGRIIHLSDEDVSDINFMLKDADMLVTDYSGAYFDFLLTEKPIIFAAFDLEEYKNSSREMYFDYESIVSGPIVYNWVELTNSIAEIIRENKYKEQIKSKNLVFNKYHDANNSKRVFMSLLNIHK
ncbi:CDP-glycerol glycerophosphotransferase family protein [Thalassobellus suaedae]|uniref:CDP-glycerol glycerophosphotransferase family protein n=1 Tax=Thalassobellus suaedae TaxID=3074124 RepID=A0ABY9Y6T1_9FLAO|nr:CDP-glycerol glycerophosphotransferase family protein [Flavobacteriaceae bacterium HL-DH10]